MSHSMTYIWLCNFCAAGRRKARHLRAIANVEAVSHADPLLTYSKKQLKKQKYYALEIFI